MGLFSRSSNSASSSSTPLQRPEIDPYPDGDPEDFTVTFTATASPEAAKRLDDSIRRSNGD